MIAQRVKESKSAVLNNQITSSHQNLYAEIMLRYIDYLDFLLETKAVSRPTQKNR